MSLDRGRFSPSAVASEMAAALQASKGGRVLRTPVPRLDRDPLVRPTPDSGDTYLQPSRALLLGAAVGGRRGPAERSRHVHGLLCRARRVPGSPPSPLWWRTGSRRRAPGTCAALERSGHGTSTSAEEPQLPDLDALLDPAISRLARASRPEPRLARSRSCRSRGSTVVPLRTGHRLPPRAPSESGRRA
jgi:hypothetical protein